MPRWPTTESTSGHSSTNSLPLVPGPLPCRLWGRRGLSLPLVGRVGEGGSHERPYFCDLLVCSKPEAGFRTAPSSPSPLVGEGRGGGSLSVSTNPVEIGVFFGRDFDAGFRQAAL